MKVGASTPLVWFGRVLHWVTLVASALWLAVWLVTARYGDPSTSALAAGVGVTGILSGILVGRVARYVLSGD